MNQPDIKPSPTLRRHPQRHRRVSIHTPDARSPYNLLQETLWEQPWKLLVATILLNQATSASTVRDVLPSFFARWPDSEAASQADPGAMAQEFLSLGLQNRRASMIIEMSKAYMTWDAQDVNELPGTGKFVADSWYVFVDPRRIKMDVEDEELGKYVRWAQRRYRLREAVKRPMSVIKKQK